MTSRKKIPKIPVTNSRHGEHHALNPVLSGIGYMLFYWYILF
jgi:hypothetical protein